jgi:hypothetical protein
VPGKVTLPPASMTVYVFAVRPKQDLKP